MNAVFTDRVTHLEPEGAYAALARAQQLEAQGREILHLEIGQPDFPTPPHIAQAGIDAIQEGHTRYTPPAGINELRALIAEDARRRRGVEFSPQMVIVASGSKPGLFFPTLALVQPGDEVIYPDPGFPTYQAMIRVAGGVPVPIQLKEEKQFSFNLDEFDSKISDKTKLIVLNSPSNPTGGVIPIEDLEYIATKAKEHNAWVLTDEIYSRLVYDGMSAPSIVSIDGMMEHAVLVDGFSKTFSMTGWRLGYMIAPLALAERLELLLTHSTGCPASFTQYAAMEAISGSQESVEQMLAEYMRRRDFIVEGLNSIPGIVCQKPQGAFYVFPNIKSFGLSSEEIARRLLDEAGVAVLAGTDFGLGGSGYLRLCYATSMDVIERALEKMQKFFKYL